MAKRKPKSTEIKPADVAKQVDQESQITPVQTLSEAQMDVSTIEPGTVLIDPKVDQEPIKEEPVVDHDAEDSEPIEDVPTENDSFDKKFEKQQAKDGVSEPTRFGAGREVPIDVIENPEGRHYNPAPTGDVTGTKNEWPR